MHAVWRGATRVKAPEETGVLPVSLFFDSPQSDHRHPQDRSATSNLSCERTLDEAQNLEGCHSGQALGH
jgi:hypothetical protein